MYMYNVHVSRVGLIKMVNTQTMCSILGFLFLKKRERLFHVCWSMIDILLQNTYCIFCTLKIILRESY